MFEALCLQIEKIIESPTPESESLLDAKLTELAACLNEKPSNSPALFDRIIQLETSILANKVKNVCILLELKLLLQGSDDQKLADWIVSRKDKIEMPETSDKREFYYALDEARERLINSELLVPEVGNALSSLVVTTLGLQEEKNAGRVKLALSMTSLDDLNQLKGFAHWINVKRIPLEVADLNEKTLNSIAPYLHFVNIELVKL